MLDLLEVLQALSVVLVEVDDVSSSVSFRPRASSDSREEAGNGDGVRTADEEGDKEFDASDFFFVPVGMAVGCRDVCSESV